MRLAGFVPALAAIVVGALAVSGVAVAQDWLVYQSRDDMFDINFPEQPVIEKFIHTSEYGSKLPANRYTAKRGAQTFILSVVDMRTTQREQNRQGTELRGAVQWASTAIRRTGTVTLDVYNEIQVVPGQMLQVTLPNGNRNYAGIYLHKRRLYIMEAIVPTNVPPPILYQASLNFLDEQGTQVRYEDNNYSFPDHIPLAGRGGGAAAAGGAGGRGAGAGAGN